MNFKKITAIAASVALAVSIFPTVTFAFAAEISGIPVVGQYLKAEYDAGDGKTVCRWYVDGEKVKTQYHTNDNKSAYLVKNEDEGKKIKYEIISENAVSDEIEIYSGDTADKIIRVIENVEAAMGNATAVGTDEQELTDTAEGCAIYWDSDRGDIVNTDGTINLPLYDDGAVETKVVMNADVDGITVSKSYDIRTATQHYPVFVNYNAENEEPGTVSEWYNGRFTVTDEEAHTGEKAYKRERDTLDTTSPHETARYVIRDNTTVPPSNVTNDTLFIARMYGKLPNGSAEKSGSGLVFINGADGVPYASRTEDANQMFKSNKWNRWEGISKRANAFITMYIYGSMARNYLIDDFEVAKLCVGSIEISNDDGEYTLEIPRCGDAPLTKEFKYKIYNQYGDDFGMVYEVNGKGVVLAEDQTAHFGIKGKLPEGVEFDTETGILTVSDNAKEGDIVITATSDDGDLPGNGWVRGEKTITLKAKDDKKPQARNIKVAGTTEENARLEVSYEYYHAADEVEEGTTYRWLKADTDNENDYSPIEGATDKTYTVTADDAGKYIRCEITPKTADGTTGDPTMSNVVAAAAPPQALDIKLEMPEYIGVGATVGMSYTYYDINFDNEAETEYTWQRSDFETDGFEDIDGTHTVKNGTKKIEYTLTDSDIGKYIRIKILPKSDNADDVSDYCYSDAMAGPSYPTASNVGISGTVKVGNTVSGVYNYSHIHGYDETDSTYEWYLDERLVGTGKTYTIKESDEGGELVFAYTPKTSVAPKNGETVKSIAVKVRNGSSVETDGVPIPGETLTACDIGGEKNVCRWYVDGVKVKTEYHGTGHLSTYEITENDVGKFVSYFITSEDGTGEIESTEQEIYGGETAEKISEVLNGIETALGDLNAVGGENSSLVSAYDESPVSWDGGRNITIENGKIKLPLYDDGPIEGTLKMSTVAAGININKSYDVKTATQHYPVFAFYDAESEKVGDKAKINGDFTVSDDEVHSGKNAYKKVLTEQSGSSPWTLTRFNVGTETVPASPVGNDTLFFASMYGKLPYEYGGNCGNGAMYIAGGGMPYTYKIDADKGMNNKTWTRWLGWSTVTNSSVQALVYNQLPLQYIIDDFEIAKVCVGSISVSNKDDDYTVTIPNIGETAQKQYIANIFNQYGTVDAMTKNVSNGKEWGIEQTAHFELRGKNLDGVEIDSSTGVLSVSGNAKEGEIKVVAIADKTDLPGSGWVCGERTVTLKSNESENPQARNVFAKGVLKAGERITANYEFYQKNNAVEEGTTYQWLIADEDTAESYRAIEGENTLEYVVKPGDVGKLIRCEITPKSADGTVGTPVRTNVVASETAPRILSSKYIEPQYIATGSTIELEYEFYDVNYDNEAETEYTWQRADSADGTFEDIPGTHSIRNTADEKVEYTFTADDTDKYIRIKIMPKSDTEPYSPSEPYYGDAMYGPARPIAVDVSITGNAKVGNTITGSYKFTHPHSYGESGSTYAWYRDGAIVGTEAVYTIGKADEGSSICFEVTPKSSVDPGMGNPVKSSPVTVGKNKSSGISVGGGGGSSVGSGSVYGGGAAAVSQITPKPQYQNPFADITDHWAYNDIVKMAELGIAKGTSENMFSPDLSITRAEFITLTLRVLDEDEREYKPIFDDVSQDAWYAGYITTAAELNIISNKAQKAYPESKITRQEMAKIAVEAYKTAGGKTDETTQANFADSAEINEWAKEYVNAAATLGIIKGTPDGRFNPTEGATRAEALTVIKRLYEMLES